MDAEGRADLEARVRELCVAASFDAAATLAVRGYGPELCGFLVAVTGSETDGSELFSELAEAIWRGLPKYTWEATLRTWAYAIARNLVRLQYRDGARQRRRAPETDESHLDGVAQAVRTETLAFLRTEKRTRLQALRDRLDPEDRMLLVLRVDKDLAWNDLARILNDEAGHGALDGAALTREAARLRKRFQTVRERLRELAREEGLLEE